MLAGAGKIDHVFGLDAPGELAFHQDDAVAEEQGLVDVVGDEDDGALFLFPDTRGLLLHEHTGLGVQLSERLVKEHDVRGVRIGAGDAHALLHTAGQLMRVVLFKAGQPHHVDVVLRNFVPLVGGDIAELEA